MCGLFGLFLAVVGGDQLQDFFMHEEILKLVAAYYGND